MASHRVHWGASSCFIVLSRESKGFPMLWQQRQFQHFSCWYFFQFFCWIWLLIDFIEGPLLVSSSTSLLNFSLYQLILEFCEWISSGWCCLESSWLQALSWRMSELIFILTYVIRLKFVDECRSSSTGHDTWKGSRRGGFRIFMSIIFFFFFTSLLLVFAVLRMLWLRLRYWGE